MSFFRQSQVLPGRLIRFFTIPRTFVHKKKPRPVFFSLVSAAWITANSKIVYFLDGSPEAWQLYLTEYLIARLLKVAPLA